MWPWPSALPGTLFSQNLVLAPAQACDSAGAEQGFPDPISHPGQPRDFSTPGHTKDIPTPGHPSQVMPICLAFLLLSRPTPSTTPGWQLPSRHPGPTPMPSFLALECGIEKALGHVA